MFLNPNQSPSAFNFIATLSDTAKLKTLAPIDVNNDFGEGGLAMIKKTLNNQAIALESGRLVLQKPASKLLVDPNIERLFLGARMPALPILPSNLYPEILHACWKHTEHRHRY